MAWRTSLAPWARPRRRGLQRICLLPTSSPFDDPGGQDVAVDGLEDSLAP